MGLLGNIGNWLWNGAKGITSAIGIDTSSFENDEAQKFQAQQSQISRDWQEKMLENQMAYQTDMWNKTNEYNSASSVMQRYREAGLNPYMMMSGGNAGFGASSPGAPSSPSAPSQSGGFAGTNYTPAGQFIKSLSDMKVNQSIQRKNDADSTLKEVEANTHAAQLIANLEKTRLTNQEQRIVNHFKFDTLDSTAKLIKAQEFSLNAKAKLDLMNEAYKAIEVEQLPALLKTQIAESASRIDLNRSNAKEVLSREILNKANAAKVKLDTKTAKRMANAIVEKAQHDAYNARYNGPTNIFQSISGIGRSIDYHFRGK